MMQTIPIGSHLSALEFLAVENARVNQYLTYQPWMENDGLVVATAWRIECQDSGRPFVLVGLRPGSFWLSVDVKHLGKISQAGRRDLRTLLESQAMLNSEVTVTNETIEATSLRLSSKEAILAAIERVCRRLG